MGILIAYINARIDGLRSELRGEMNGLRAEMNIGFTAINQRFDDMVDLWRAELRRVEEVLDARLKHLEGRA